MRDTLSTELCCSFRGHERFGQHLDRNVALQIRVGRAVLLSLKATFDISSLTVTWFDVYRNIFDTQF